MSASIVAPCSSSAPFEEPSILLIVAGGTICMQDSPAGLVPSAAFVDSCLAGGPLFLPHHDDDDGYAGEEQEEEDPSASATAVDEHGVRRRTRSFRLAGPQRARVSVLEFSPLLDSAAAHAPTWHQLARTISANASSFSAFVVCHGTDTLAYTASALALLLGPGPPLRSVILTGAQRSMFLAPSDAASNLSGSLALAARLPRLPHVAVFFANRLLRGIRITKLSAAARSAFASPNCPPIASISPATREILLSSSFPPLPSHPIPAPLPFPLLSTDSLALIKLYPGLSPAFLASLLAPPLRAAVLETFGAGTPPPSLLPVFSAAAARGVVLVAVSQCVHGAVARSYAPAKALFAIGRGADAETAVPVACARDMTAEAAFVKLAFVLAREEEKGPGDVLDLGRRVVCEMERNLNGEMTMEGEEGEDGEEVGEGAGVERELGVGELAGMPIRYAPKAVRRAKL